MWKPLKTKIVSNGKIQHDIWFKWFEFNKFKKKTWKTHAYNFITILIMAYVGKFILLFSFYFIQIHLWSFKVCAYWILNCFHAPLFFFLGLGHLPFFQTILINSNIHSPQNDFWKKNIIGTTSLGIYEENIVLRICFGWRIVHMSFLVDIFNFHSLHIWTLKTH